MTEKQPNTQQPLANNVEKEPFIPPAHDPSAALHDGFAPGWGLEELFSWLGRVLQYNKEGK